MAYRKSVKGSNIESNETASHNRIYIEAGISGLVLVLFAIGLVTAAIIWMIARQGALFSILIIGSFLCLFLGAGVVGVCFLVVRVSDALRAVRVNRILASTVIAGEVVAYHDGEEWTHLSSIHEQGKIMPALPMKAESLNTDESTILELYDKGLSLRAIEKQLKDTGVTYYQIQKVTSAHRK